MTYGFSCVTSQQYLSNIIPVSCCCMYVKSQQKSCLSTNFASSLFRRNAEKENLNFRSFYCHKSVQTENHCQRSIATSSSSAILDCSSPASNSITHPIRISTPNMVIFIASALNTNLIFTASCDHDLSNKIPTFLCPRIE